MSREARRRWKSSAAAKPCLPNLKRHSELARATSGSVQRKLDLSYVASKSDSETGDLSLPNLMDCLKVENIALPSVADGGQTPAIKDVSTKKDRKGKTKLRRAAWDDSMDGQYLQCKNFDKSEKVAKKHSGFLSGRLIGHHEVVNGRSLKIY